MKKTSEPYQLNSKIGKSWTLDSMDNKNYDLPDNFIMGMTNGKSESN
ncbi:hypothetical protein QSE00_14740 [Arenibacter sp. M-2]|nr:MULTISPECIES: hypothetical protein [unclassified Arenibacter]MDL5513082.1 hypothetical protein [Arenibacter sp. M-2]PXX27275.1 hypothetical protein C7972_10759 [Arenibacter sp. ARW7G5Y1]